MTTLYDVLLASAAAALPLLDRASGAMPPGNNGPYLDPETPVRNTGHWMITFLKAHTLSHNVEFLAAARRAASYLQRDEARPTDATFWHRKNATKDSCNGLVGQAWTIEALAWAAMRFPDERLRSLGKEVFLLHPFDDDLALWHRVDVDGSVLSCDSTFNHQLWFAAAGALLLPDDDPRVSRRVVRFLDGLPETLQLYSSGLIRHALMLGPRAVRWLRRLKRTLRHARRERRLVSDVATMHHKAVGYHAFNLYALGMLRQSIPNHSFWGSEQMRRVLSFARTDDFVDALENNHYGYPYNPVGFEMAFALHSFYDDTREEQEHWVHEQLRRTYDWESHMMRRGTTDPITLAARLYEAVRLPNLVLHVSP